jgi:acyl-CoA synthetase (AMP-forming)/AMP-acid ligase II
LKLQPVSLESNKIAVKEKRINLYYLWEDAVKRRGNNECIWSREGCYTWNQAYDRVNQYAQFFLSQGVKEKELVAFFLNNSADFVFAWMGLWAIGAAPAHINYNLTGKALLHCLKISGAKIVLVDPETDLRNRIEEVRGEIEGELGMRTIILDADQKQKIGGLPATRPDNKYRDNTKGSDPMVLLYTRYDHPNWGEMDDRA